MPVDVEFQEFNVEELARKLGKSPEVVSTAITDAMQAITDTVEQAVIDRTPVNTGALRSSIYAQVYGIPGSEEFYGKVATGIIYGEPVEYGTSPHGVSPDGVKSIEYWVIRKLGVTPQEAPGVARAIVRAIMRRGSKGAHMFRDGLEAARPKITKLWNDIPKRISERLD